MSQTSHIPLGVTSEIGHLERIMIHYPDNGLAKVIPSKAQDWLFEDIIHLEVMRREEYDHYMKLLLYFLDPEKIKGKLDRLKDPKTAQNFFNPESEQYVNSEYILDPQRLLGDILAERDLKQNLVASICAIERTPYFVLQELLDLSPHVLAHTLISGTRPGGGILFPTVPNFNFTRDIGIVINDHVLLNRPAKLVRIRESLIMKYIFYNHPYFSDYRDKIIEIRDTDHPFFLDEEDKAQHQVTLEGGDIMVVSPDHLLIGLSERTSLKAVNLITEELFKRNLVRKVSVIQIPKRRDFMHIDTVFTQVKRNVWVLFGALSKQNKLLSPQGYLQDEDTSTHLQRPKITQFVNDDTQSPRPFEFLEDLLDAISQEDLGATEPTQFIYSGKGEFPFELREQWTDSCNVLALKEGVVVGYDRNQKTSEAFAEAGFQVRPAWEVIEQLENGSLTVEEIKDTLILLPSAELSRARGGSHCMSLPLCRQNIS